MGIEVSKAPESSIFIRFRNNFHLIPKDDPKRVMREVNINSQKKILLLKFIIEILLRKYSHIFIRGDYKN